jgi:hypothetical protein
MTFHTNSRCRGLSTPLLVAVLLIPALALLAAVVLQPWVPVAYLLRDPLVVAEEAAECCSASYGFVSNLGIVLWIASGSMCLLMAVQLRLARAEPGAVTFFLAGGLFTLWLGADDFFLVHENVLARFDVPQAMVYAAYAVAGLAYLALARGQILSGRVSLFLIGGACLAGSMGLDAMVHSEAELWVFLEDAVKFVGIVFWAGFHVTSALAAAAEIAAGRVTTVAVVSGSVVRLAERRAA